ncbi:MAG: hypothetical protein ACOC43_13920 [Desulfohalobiaceae bacterium]
MFLHWLPWKYILKRTAKAYGIMDPISFMARVRRFAQPSEVQEPIELLRAGIIFHARGLINNKAIQHNLDWVWPYWVERQFNPADPSFIPRGFSFSQVNLTHRNWTALGLPDCDLYPLVDPRGLVTPFYNGWSLDFWILRQEQSILLPSRLDSVQQNLSLLPEHEIQTLAQDEQSRLQSTARVKRGTDGVQAEIDIQASSMQPGWLVVCLRPYNPEGIQFIEKVEYLAQEACFLVNSSAAVGLHPAPHRICFSRYASGDVLHRLNQEQTSSEISCNVGLATAAALFPIQKSKLQSQISLTAPLQKTVPSKDVRIYPTSWPEAEQGSTRIQLPDQKIEFLFQAAQRTLVLLSSEDLVPGPYTYKRFWFRDACLMLQALLVLGYISRCRKHIQGFLGLQKTSGYFHSQEGEWDSNGQVLWILERFQQLSNQELKPGWGKVIHKAVRWINKKRSLTKDKHTRHFGLLPPGFSAEHFGPNDYYYWDDFWALAGMRSAARLLGKMQGQSPAERILDQADDLEQNIWQSIEAIPENQARGGIPASPYRRMDSGAIGSLVADYPLQLLSPGHPRIKNTICSLMQNNFFAGGFFQDMIHSGINPYLTLDIAQTLLRDSDLRCLDLLYNIAHLASDTGQWPEAIHPKTKGGCMGDGQHGWAAAEWIMLMRNLFVREEGQQLILGQGVDPEWLKAGQDILFGPVLTPWGSLSLKIYPRAHNTELHLEKDFFAQPERILVCLPGHKEMEMGMEDKNLCNSPAG